MTRHNNSFNASGISSIFIGNIAMFGQILPAALIRALGCFIWGAMKTRNIFLLAIILLVIQSDAIPASRCLKRRSVSEEIKDSTAVFAGLVVAEEYRPVGPKEDHFPDGGEVLVIRIAVEQWWKGSGDEEVILYTGVTRYPGGLTRIISEDFKFRVGKRYLVYASGPKDKLGTNGCRRTAELEKAEEDLQKLGENKFLEKKQ